MAKYQKGYRAADRKKDYKQKQTSGWCAKTTSETWVEPEESDHDMVNDEYSAPDQPSSSTSTADPPTSKFDDIGERLTLLAAVISKANETAGASDLKLFLLGREFEALVKTVKALGQEQEEREEKLAVFMKTLQEDVGAIKLKIEQLSGNETTPQPVTDAPQPLTPLEVFNVRTQYGGSTESNDAYDLGWGNWTGGAAISDKPVTPTREGRKKRNETCRSGSLPPPPRATNIFASCDWHRRGNLDEDRFIPEYMGERKTIKEWMIGDFWNSINSSVFFDRIDTGNRFWFKMLDIFTAQVADVWYDHRLTNRHFTIKCRKCNEGCILPFTNKYYSRERVEEAAEQLMSFICVPCPPRQQV